MLSPVDQIKERLSIVDVVSSYLKLDKAGQNYRARCPFHNEKTPSFFVSPTRSSYHCFGCNKGGDIFSFVEEIDGVPFIEALKMLAERAGVTLGPTGVKDAGVDKKAYDLLELATKFFEFNLDKNEAIKQYLEGRGLKNETIKSFRIGYALNGWENLVKFLQARGFSDRLIEQSGLAAHGQRGYYDRFRSRIMFPIADSQGRIIAFTGRIFPASAEGGPASGGKYVNSPETDLYNKSKILYGYDKAKRAILKGGSALIVEGQMDLILAHQAGNTNTVAVSGTALTEEHIRLIKRFTDKIRLAFDADQAGLKASERGVKMALQFGVDVRVVELPNSWDPADFILNDLAGWQKALDGAKPIIDFYLDHLEAQNLSPREFQLEVSRKVLPYIYWIESSIDQAHFIKEIAKRLDIGEDAVRTEIEKDIARQEKNRDLRTDGNPDRIEKKTRREQVEEKILGLYLWQKEKKETEFRKVIETRFQEITGREMDDFMTELKSQQQLDLIFQAEMYYSGDHDLKQETEELLDNFEKEVLEEKLANLMQGLRKAEQGKNEAKTEEIMKECHLFSKKINEIKNRRFIEK